MLLRGGRILYLLQSKMQVLGFSQSCYKLAQITPPLLLLLLLLRRLLHVFPIQLWQPNQGRLISNRHLEQRHGHHLVRPANTTNASSVTACVARCCPPASHANQLSDSNPATHLNFSSLDLFHSG